MENKKEYTLKINGIEQSIKDVTKLEDAVRSLDAELGKNQSVTVNMGKAVREHTKALTDEEKAAKKLEETQRKIAQANTEANLTQIKANQALREATREATLKAKADMAAANSIDEMRTRLSILKDEWKTLDVGSEKFSKMSEEIRELNDRIKEAEVSTGDFRRNVGNYESALDGLGKLSEGIEGTTKTSMGLAQSLLGVNSLMSLFGNQSDENAESAQRLQKVIALLSIAQQVNENVLKQGIVQNKLAVVTDTIRTTQIKAKTAAEVASTKGTIAATAAQKVFNAVAKANPYVLLVLGLVAVTTALAAFVSGDTKAKKKQEDFNQELEQTRIKLSQIKKNADFDIAISEAAGESAKAIRAMRIEAAKAAEELAYSFYTSVLNSGNASEEAIADAKKMADDAYADLQKIYDENTIAEVKALTERKEKAKEHAKEMASLAKEQAATELSERRAAEDTMLSIEEDAYKREKEQTETEYTRQIEDLKARLETEKTLTESARNFINEQIINLEKKKNQELAQLEDEHSKEIEEKRKEELKARADEAAARADLELSAVEDTLTSAERKIGEVIKRSNTGLELIDVKATRKNLADTNAALDEYIKGLINYQSDLTAAHEATLATLQKGSVKYEAEMQNYARAMEDTTERIKTAQKEQTDNTKTSNALQLEYYRDLFEKVAGYANLAADTMGAVFDTWNMGLQVQLDDLNEQLDAVNARYEEAQKLREDAAKNVESIEAKLQAATGETAAALRAQLQDATIARNDAAREEQRLAKEKEKREDEIAKKEKKMKRNELLSNIAQATADVAAGVAKALSLIWPLNLVVAGLVGATGAVQIGIMTKQLTKLADGGEIVGPSHANGGVPIPGTNYEVEGGEFVVNKISYGANSDLVKFINDTPRAITTADLMGVLPGSPAPIIVTDTGNAGEDRIIEAIEGINIHPVVAVTDIIDATDEVTAVRDLADF